MTVMRGPTPQLAVLLIKVIDFLEDTDDERRQKEMAVLSFTIVEALVLQIGQLIERCAEKDGPKFPAHLLAKSDGLLALLGKSRRLPDRLVAKDAVLRGIAEALRAFGAYAKVEYPTITDSKGNIL